LDLYTLSIKEKIMKASIVFATGLILAAGAVVGSINVAHAGSAGSAGSISAEFSTGNVLTGTAGAVAVGKTGAFTAGTANGGTPAIAPVFNVNTGALVTPGTPAGPSDFTAVAGGYGGILTVNATGTTFTVAEDLLLGTTGVQANVFDSTNKNSVNLLPSTVGVTLK
jgi:hypothetical protein